MKKILAFICIAVAGGPTGANAQHPADWDVKQPGISRAALEALRARLDSAAASRAYGDAMRAQARMLMDRSGESDDADGAPVDGDVRTKGESR